MSPGKSILLYVREVMKAGGIGTYVAQLHRALGALDIPCHVACRAGSFLEQELGGADRVHVIDGRYYDYCSPFLVARLSRLVRAIGAGLVHTHASRDIWPVGQLRALAGGFTLLHSQHMEPRRKNDILHRALYSQVDLFLTVTERIRRSFIEESGIPAGRIRTFPPGVDLSRFTPCDRDGQKQARSRQNLPMDRFLILIPGRLEPAKGQEFFLEALAEHDTDLPLHVLVIGQEGVAGTRRRLEEIAAASARLRGRVEFREHSREMPDLYRAADLVAMPSRFETFGLVVVEAMACGRRVIATRQGGVPEIVVDGECGDLFDYGDPDGLRSALARAAGQIRQRGLENVSGRRRVEERFSLEGHAATLAGIYRDLLAS